MNLKKLLLMIIFILIALFTAFTVNSYAATGTINTAAVMVRKSYSKDSQALDTAYKGETVTVLGETNKWYKVIYKDKEGYIYGKYVDVSGNIEEESKSETQEAETKQEETTETNSSSAMAFDLGNSYKTIKVTKLHILPVMYSSVLQDISLGTSVKIIQIANNWAYVETDKYMGWITMVSFDENYTIVKIEETKPVEEEQPEQTEQTEQTEATEPVEEKPVETEPEPVEQKQEEQTEDTTLSGKTVYVNVETAFIRKGPSVDYEDITTVNQNTELTILGEKNSWYHIQVKDINGWINKKLVSDEKVTTTSRSLTEPRNSSVENLNIKEEEVKQEEQLQEEKQEQAKQTSNTKGTEIVEYAKQFLGGKYVSGGNNPQTGVDCSGFTKYVYSHFGYLLSRTTSGQAENGKKVEKSEMQEGDIIVFLNDAKTSIGHVGIYIGNNEFIHAANSKRGIVIDSVDNSYYKPRFVCARRII